jgi:hypothetical protein
MENKVDYSALLNEAVTEPGVMAACYHAFHGYSLGNRLLAYIQLKERGIPVGPIASYNGWKKHGRQVQRGAKAIALWMPISVGKKKDADDDDQRGGYTRFLMKNNWFAVSQTDGPDYVPETTGDWGITKAMESHRRQLPGIRGDDQDGSGDQPVGAARHADEDP